MSTAAASGFNPGCHILPPNPLLSHGCFSSTTILPLHRIVAVAYGSFLACIPLVTAGGFFYERFHADSQAGSDWEVVSQGCGPWRTVVRFESSAVASFVGGFMSAMVRSLYLMFWRCHASDYCSATNCFLMPLHLPLPKSCRLAVLLLRWRVDVYVSDLGRIPDILIVVECLGILFQFGIPFVGPCSRRSLSVPLPFHLSSGRCWMVLPILRL